MDAAPKPEHALAPAARAHVERAGRRAYPAEACGFLIGRRDAARVEVVEACDARNLLAGSRDRFRADPVDHLAAEQRAASAGQAVVGVWHSHPDGPATPSELDRRDAWSGWSYLIVGVARGEVTEVRAWRLVGEHFVEESLGG